MCANESVYPQPYEDCVELEVALDESSRKDDEEDDESDEESEEEEEEEEEEEDDDDGEESDEIADPADCLSQNLTKTELQLGVQHPRLWLSKKFELCEASFEEWMAHWYFNQMAEDIDWPRGLKLPEQLKKYLVGICCEKGRRMADLC